MNDDLPPYKTRDISIESPDVLQDMVKLERYILGQHSTRLTDTIESTIAALDHGQPRREPNSSKDLTDVYEAAYLYVATGVGQRGTIDPNGDGKKGTLNIHLTSLRDVDVSQVESEIRSFFELYRITL